MNTLLELKPTSQQTSNASATHDRKTPFFPGELVKLILAEVDSDTFAQARCANRTWRDASRAPSVYAAQIEKSCPWGPAPDGFRHINTSSRQIAAAQNNSFSVNACTAHLQSTTHLPFRQMGRWWQQARAADIRSVS